MAGIFAIQPQRVAVGSFKGSDGSDVPVYMSQPWYRALEALSKVTVPSATVGGVTIDLAPPYAFGGIVFPSGTSTLRRLPGQQLGDILYDGGPGEAPFFGPLPDVKVPAPDDASLVLAQRSFSVPAAPAPGTAAAQTPVDDASAVIAQRTFSPPPALSTATAAAAVVFDDASLVLAQRTFGVPPAPAPAAAAASVSPDDASTVLAQRTFSPSIAAPTAAFVTDVLQTQVFGA